MCGCRWRTWSGRRPRCSRAGMTSSAPWSRSSTDWRPVGQTGRPQGSLPCLTSPCPRSVQVFCRTEVAAGRDDLSDCKAGQQLMARELVGRHGVALRSVDQLYKTVDAVENSAACGREEAIHSLKERLKLQEDKLHRLVNSSAYTCIAMLFTQAGWAGKKADFGVSGEAERWTALVAVNTQPARPGNSVGLCSNGCDSSPALYSEHLWLRFAPLMKINRRNLDCKNLFYPSGRPAVLSSPAGRSTTAEWR